MCIRDSINVLGDGETWDYSDGYAVRTGGVAGAFDQANYSSNAFALDGLDAAAQKDILATAFNFQSAAIPEPATATLIGFAALGLCGLRRRS